MLDLSSSDFARFGTSLSRSDLDLLETSSVRSSQGDDDDEVGDDDDDDNWGNDDYILTSLDDEVGSTKSSDS